MGEGVGEGQGQQVCNNLPPACLYNQVQTATCCSPQATLPPPIPLPPWTPPHPTSHPALHRRVSHKVSLTPLERYALMVAAVAHDMDHPGVSNAYLVGARAPLATTYNDNSGAGGGGRGEAGAEGGGGVVDSVCGVILLHCKGHCRWSEIWCNLHDGRCS